MINIEVLILLSIAIVWILIGYFSFRNNTKKDDESAIEDDDNLNRTFFGGPTLGGFIIVGLVILFIAYQILFN